MPDAVRAAVRNIIMSEGQMTDDEADKYLDQMDRTRRYQAETWSWCDTNVSQLLCTAALTV